MKKLLYVIGLSFISYIALFILLPIFFRGKSNLKEVEKNLEAFKFCAQNDDYISILEDPILSGDVRLQLLDSAQSTIDICYHTIKEGHYTTLFFNSLLSAADRGVKIRFIIDEMMGCMSKKTQKILSSYPNIELYLYEKGSFLRPWTINNRMHDKMLIIDSKIAITGGRNLADKLYGYDQKLIEPVYDRDFIIKRDGENSIINSMEEYFNQLLNLEYVEKVEKGESTKGFRFDGVEERLKCEPFDFTKMNIKPEAIMRISNPQGRMSKAPIIWDTLIALMKNAKKEVIIQSPYIVPTHKQIKQLESIDVPIYYMTNSINTTPNFPAFSAYLISKPAIEKTGTIEEYNGCGSIHAKTILIDDDISIIGSFNFDPRSVYLDTESMYVIKSKELNAALRDIMHYYADEESATSSWIKKVALYAVGIISFPLRMLV